MADTYSLVRKAADLTGWSHPELAELLGVSRQLVQKIVAGETPEYLNTTQMAALLGAVRLYRDQVVQGVEDLEAFL